MRNFAVALVLGAILLGCASKEQKRYAEYLPVARACVSSLEQMKPFTESDVGGAKWKSALAQVKSDVAKLKNDFSDESNLRSYKSIVEALRFYTIARSNVASAEPTPDDNKGDTVGDVYIADAERDNALKLGAIAIADARTALDAEK